jgi:flavodoxin
MKIAIVYFSLSGRTELLSGLAASAAREEKAGVAVFRLETGDTGSFIKNCMDAFGKKTAMLKEVPDTKGFDMLFLCTPVWAFDITPAMRSFIGLSDMRGKGVFLMTTYGSGKGKERAMKSFESLVREAGGEVLGKSELKGRKVIEEFDSTKGGIKKCLEQFRQTKPPGR